MFNLYFETLESLSHQPLDATALSAMYDRDVSRSRNLGQPKPRRYKTKTEYRRSVQDDFIMLRRLIRRQVSAGIRRLGPSCYTPEAAGILLERLGWPRQPELAKIKIADVIRAVKLVPILHDTTRDIGITSSVRQIFDSEDSSLVVPAVWLTSSFNVTLTQISRLLIRRTFTSVGAPSVDDAEVVARVLGKVGAIALCQERRSLSTLQRDARILFHLLGIWILGDPFPTPKIDQAVLDFAVVDTLQGDEPVNMLTLELKSGWCLFEAFHEFAHVLQGDWLKPNQEWSEDAEHRADDFATACLLTTSNEFSRVFYLRGVCSFLRLLGIVEQRYGRSSRYATAWDRAARIESFVVGCGELDAWDRKLFEVSGDLDLLAIFCHDPSALGFASETVFGE